MSFGDELINVESRELVAGLSIRLDAGNLGAASSNANALAHALNHLQGHGGGIIFFPPGRYYIGAPDARQMGETGRADFVVGDRVTLWFSPGATLVPMTVGSGAGARKVLIEVRGYIDAGIHPIFDVMLDPTREDSPSAGEVMFTRSGVRQVYPELSGAHISLYPLELRCSGALHPS